MEMNRGTVAMVLGMAMVLGGGAGAAGQKGSQKERGGGKTAGDKVRAVLPEVEQVFTKVEITLMKNYFTTNKSGLPPGLAKRDKLPPGLERQLQRNGTLPPGLQKKVQPLPADLERQMRVLPTGWRRVVIAGNVILMNEKTATIYDIVRNVIP